MKETEQFKHKHGSLPTIDGNCLIAFFTTDLWPYE
jgi:hypothetical protein